MGHAAWPASHSPSPRKPSWGCICLLTIPSFVGMLRKQMVKGAGRRRLPAAVGHPTRVAVARAGWEAPGSLPWSYEWDSCYVRRWL